MRTITATERATVASLTAKGYGKFEITDPDGTWRDVTTSLQGVDWFNKASISASIDQNAMMLSAELLRETSTYSLSPFRSDSLINRNAGGSYAPMLELWRRWRCSVGVMPDGYPPTGSDWKEIAAGRIDRISIQDKPGRIVVSGRSEDAILQACWIAVERSYGSVGGIAMETVIQSMLDDNLGSGVVTLYTPVSPSYLMNVWTQPVGNLMDALTAVAEKAGFVLRFRYDSSNVFRCTLFKPNRTASVEDWSLHPSEYTALTKCDVDVTGVRTFGKLNYADSTTGKQTVYSPKNAGTVSSAAGTATFSTSQAGVIANGDRIVVHGRSGSFIVSAFNGTTGCTLTPATTFSATNFGSSASLTRYDRFDIEIDLSYETQVNDGTKAQGFIDAVVDDLELPPLEQQVETPGFWFPQLHDYGRLYANGAHYDQDQYGGVQSIDWIIDQGNVRASLGLRAKPAGRYAAWRGLAAETVGTGTQSPQNTNARPIQLRVSQVSVTESQVIVRVEPITPNVPGPVSVAYSAGGATVSPASPQTIAATTDFATTGHQDFTITRDTQGGTPRRIEFTGSAAGYIDGTNGVDVPPNTTRFRCKVFNSTAQSLSTGTAAAITWDSESYDTGSLHSTSSNTSKITVPTDGNTGVWKLTGQVAFVGNVNGDRTVEIRKNGTTIGMHQVRACAGAGNAAVIPVHADDDAPSVGDSYEVFATQDSGGNLNTVSGVGNSFFSATHQW